MPYTISGCQLHKKGKTHCLMEYTGRISDISFVAPGVVAVLVVVVDNDEFEVVEWIARGLMQQ